VSARLVSGALRCRDISDSIHAETQSGDVTVEASGGNIVVISAIGRCVDPQAGRQARVSSGTGDVELELQGRFAGGEISTTTGDVSLASAGSDLELRAETLSGQLDGPGADAAAHHRPPPLRHKGRGRRQAPPRALGLRATSR
jgi:DUF4097 and DUF4098 domain-containing protein YvlB